MVRTRATTSAIAVAWVVLVGTAGWLGLREPTPPPTPVFSVGLDELAPLVEAPVRSGAGGAEPGYRYDRFEVGADGVLLVEAVWQGAELPDLVPARTPPDLTLEQRQAFDLATLEGEEAIAAWRRETGRGGPHLVRRGRVLDERVVGCVRLIVSADRTGPVDRAALAELVAAVEDRLASRREHDAGCVQGVDRG